MNKVKVCVIAGCLALTFAAPVGAKSLQVQPIGDRFPPLSNMLEARLEILLHR